MSTLFTKYGREHSQISFKAEGQTINFIVIVLNALKHRAKAIKTHNCSNTMEINTFKHLESSMALKVYQAL